MRLGAEKTSFPMVRKGHSRSIEIKRLVKYPQMSIPQKRKNKLLCSKMTGCAWLKYTNYSSRPWKHAKVKLILAKGLKKAAE